MADIDEFGADPQRPSVFLSYASEDREAARTLRDALVVGGLEVWYDENELGGGEAWDQKIRRQIRECDYFMPLISARTEARIEGYFRREWRLASERTLDMADDHLFVLPVVIDDTNTGTARVPEKFLGVQWLKVPGGRQNASLTALCRRLTAGNVAPLSVTPASARARPPAARQETAVDSTLAVPAWVEAFPRKEPGERARYWVRIVLWVAHAVRSVVRRWPKWVRWAAYGWAVVFFFSNVHFFQHNHPDAVRAAKVEKLKALAGNHDDLAKLGANIANALSDADSTSAGRALLAIPFSTPEGDAAAEQFAETTFSKVVAQLAKSHAKQVGQADDPLPSYSTQAAVERGAADHATYVLAGLIDTENKVQSLTLRMVSVADGAVHWTQAYPVETDPTKIALDVDTKITELSK